MPFARLSIAALAILLAATTAVTAQERPPQPPDPIVTTVVVEALTAEQESELAAWLSVMDEWRRHEMKWKNRPRHDAWGRISGRRPPPDAPSWLGTHCASMAAASIPQMDACRLLADPWAETAAVPLQSKALAAEKPRKNSSFLTRVHLDGLWTTAAKQGRAYGLVGSHVSLVDIGRFQVFGPPGVLLLSVPDVEGKRRIALGYTWGVSVRLADVRIFDGKDMTLFLNVSKVWINGGGQALDIAGFSLAPRRKR